MRTYNALITILLAFSILSCVDNTKDKENYFSINETILKPKYNSSEQVNLEIINNENKTIDSIIYFINNEKVNMSKGCLLYTSRCV